MTYLTRCSLGGLLCSSCDPESLLAPAKQHQYTISQTYSAEQNKNRWRLGPPIRLAEMLYIHHVTTVQWRHQLLYFFQGNFLVLIYLSPQQGRDTLVDVLQPNEWRHYRE